MSKSEPLDGPPEKKSRSEGAAFRDHIADMGVRAADSYAARMPVLKEAKDYTGAMDLILRTLEAYQRGASYRLSFELKASKLKGVNYIAISRTDKDEKKKTALKINADTGDVVMLANKKPAYPRSVFDLSSFDLSDMAQ
jgi:hypothetical protein